MSAHAQTSWRAELGLKLLGWAQSLQPTPEPEQTQRPCVLLFCHGYSLAHTMRPLVLARALRARGYPVVVAGRGPHMHLVQDQGWAVADVETLPQDQIDAAVSRSDYSYYDLESIDRCVQSERALIRATHSELVIHDFKPTAALSARLEGVDDARITQAYNQPRYRFRLPLPSGLTQESGPFAAYLAEHASQVRPQRTLFLLADIPEFHPPSEDDVGHYYVGPLLASRPRPETVPALDEGWDLRLPLVYVTCGSSGRDPDYLDQLLQSAAGLPLRFAVTTAGRWRCEAPPENVRVFDFCPGEWILAGAAVLAGVPGIGAIYQALSCGVPVVGAAEHLDQEYHLNRVRDLGLGVKLDRRALCGSSLLAAVQSVVADRDAYRSRCLPLAEALARWNGGEPAADLLDRHFATRRNAYQAGAGALVPAAWFERYLTDTTCPELTATAVRRLLAHGLTRGMPAERRAGQLWFDEYESWNWLHDQEPGFFEVEYRAHRARRLYFHSVASAGLRMKTPAQRYRVRYTLTLEPGPWRGRRVKVFAPVPVVRPDQQEPVTLLRCWPDAMAASLAPSAGFYYGHTAVVDAEPMEFGYEADVCAHERRRDVTAATAAPSDRRWLQLPDGFALLPEVVALRQALSSGPDQPAKRAEEIYRRLLATTRFRKTLDRGYGLGYSAQRVLRAGVGHCVSLTRTFVGLCRAEGIPARELTGALLGYLVGPGRLLRQGFCEPVFGHTWAEIWLAGCGWVPVEFHGIDIGLSADSGANVADPQVRAWMAAEGPHYERYYFGNTDNQRLLCSNSAKTIPPVLVEDPSRSVGDPERWRFAEGLPFTCRLEVEAR